MIEFHSMKFYTLLKFTFIMVFYMSNFKARKEMFKIIKELIYL